MKKDTSETVRMPVPPLILMIIFLGVALVFGWKLPIPIPFPVWMKAIGGMIVLFGFGLAFSAVRAMRKVQTSPNPSTPTIQIATSGPYKISRNPIYFGYIAIGIGFPLVMGTYWGLVLSPMVIDAYYRLIIMREEIYLTQKFGKTYTDYQSKVQRWL